MTVIGVPVLNHPELLARMVASIDIAATLFVIDNSPELVMGDVAEEHLPDGVTLTVTEPPANLGVAASWNLVVRAYPAEPFWIIANADVEFGPGDLERLCRAAADEPGAVHRLCEWGAFALPLAVVEAVGEFDENFAPIYCEDADYERRCALLGVAIRDIPSGVTHVGSVSYRGNSHAADNARTYPANVAYYEAKWGGRLRGGETYSHPFDDPSVPVWAWRPSPSRIAAQRWRP